MPHYYLDIETTGLDPEIDQILTIQYQKISVTTGEAVGPLTILKSWEDERGEQGIVARIIPLIMSYNPFNFVPVGNNLNFEFRFLTEKINKHTNLNIDPVYFHSRPHIDLKPVMILLNAGRFKGYHLILKKSASGASVPTWFADADYEKIIDYVKDEARSFVAFYFRVHLLMFNSEFRDVIFNSNRSIDDFA